MLLVAAAAWLVARSALPPPPDPGVPTAVVVHDVPLGATLGDTDVAVVDRPADTRPAAALGDAAAAVGQVLSAPVLAGEVLTPARFRGPGQLSGLPAGLVAVSVPVGDPGLAAVLRPGDRVGVLALGTGQPLVTGGRVLGSGAPSGGVLGGETARAVLVAVGAAEARAVAAALGAATAGAGGPGGVVVVIEG